MDIIFQSGEFYNSGTDWASILATIISSLVGAIISGLIAVWIFRQGIKSQRQLEQAKEDKRIAEIEKFIFHIIKSNITPLKDQIKSNISLIGKLKLNQTANFTYRFNNDLSFDDLETIDQKDLFSIFLLKGSNNNNQDKAVNFRNLKNAVRIVTTIGVESRELLKYVDTKYQMYQDAFGALIDKIQRVIEHHSHFLDTQKIELTSDKFLFSIWQIILKWSELKGVDNRDPYVLNEHYLKPMRELCAKFHTDARKPEIIDLILATQHELEQIDNIKQLYREWVVKDTRQLIKAEIRIEASIKTYIAKLD